MFVLKSTALVAALAALLWILTLLLVGENGVQSTTTSSLLRSRNLLSFGFADDPKTVESKEDHGLDITVTADPFPTEGSDDVLDTGFINRNWNAMWRWSEAYRTGPNGVVLQGRDYTEKQGWSLKELFDHLPVPRSSDTIHMYSER